MAIKLCAVDCVSHNEVCFFSATKVRLFFQTPYINKEKYFFVVIKPVSSGHENFVVCHVQQKKYVLSVLVII